MHLPLSLFSLGAISAFALGLASCSSTSVSLDYQPRLVQTVPGPRAVAAGRFGDMRGEDPYLLGVVRTPIGTPLEKVTTNVPLEQVVRNSFAYGLKTRQMLLPEGVAPFILTGEVLQFEVKQIVHPAAYVKIRVTVMRSGSGQVVYSKVFKSDREGDIYLPGSGSPVPTLSIMGSRALQDVVDHALDDVTLRSALEGPPPPPGPPTY